jgi:hypothetical protein
MFQARARLHLIPSPDHAGVGGTVAMRSAPSMEPFPHDHPQRA